jgi:hypothetical protein
VAQLFEELVETLVEPRVVAQQAAQLDLLELHHQRQGRLAGLRRRGPAAGTSNRCRAVAQLFEPAGRRLFGSDVRCSLSLVRSLVEHREKSATPFETSYFSAIYPHS